jgi:glycosyltransferase involved in cell wall biosynthesis
MCHVCGEGDRLAAERPRPTAVVVAYSASRRTGNSVPRIGFEVAKGISERAEAALIFHANEREGVTGKFAPERVHFAGSRRLARGLRRLSVELFPENWNLISMIEFLDYFIFDFHAYLIARRLVDRGAIDYVLRVNPISLLFPSVLPRLRAPVFTGPHNGGMEWPPAFSFLERNEPTGHQFRRVGHALHRLYGDTARYAGIFVGTDMCARSVPAQHRHKVVVVPENGIDAIKPIAPHAGDARRLLFVGRLIECKGVAFIIRALARLPNSVSLTIVGDGPHRRDLEALARRLHVSDRCQFLGRRPHDEVEAIYHGAGVFVFPSLRDSGGAVVLEAMAHGLPCVVAAWGGPATYTEAVGLQLSVASPAALEDDLVSKLEHLLRHPSAARTVGQNSRDLIANEFLWAQRADQLQAAMVARIADQRLVGATALRAQAQEKTSWGPGRCSS